MNPGSALSHWALFPPSASTLAGRVDGLTFGLIAISSLILIFLAGLILTFCVLYRSGSNRSRIIEPRGENLLEWGWTIVTTFVFFGLFVWAAIVFFQIHSPPNGAEEIAVVGKQWMWKFQHADGTRELNELHVPVGRPILLKMISQDAIHSLFVPAFRMKQDVLPDRYTYQWFQATRAGEFHLFCTQYCGTQHSGMRGRIVALPESEYRKWLQSGVSGGVMLDSLVMATRGGRLFTRLGCISCHGVNPGVRAPTLSGIFGKPVGLSDGTSVIADESYIRESILHPGVKVVMGYQDLMPSFEKLVSEDDVQDLIAYIKALRETPTGEAPGPEHTSPALPIPPSKKENP